MKTNRLTNLSLEHQWTIVTKETRKECVTTIQEWVVQKDQTQTKNLNPATSSNHSYVLALLQKSHQLSLLSLQHWLLNHQPPLPMQWNLRPIKRLHNQLKLTPNNIRPINWNKPRPREEKESGRRTRYPRFFNALPGWAATTHAMRSLESWIWRVSPDAG